MNTIIIAIFTCFSAAFLLFLLIVFSWWAIEANTEPSEEQLSDFDRETKERQDRERETRPISDGLRYCKHCGLFCRLDQGPCPICHDPEEIKTDESDDRYKGWKEYEDW